MEGVSRLVRACNLSAFRLSAGRGVEGVASGHGAERAGVGHPARERTPDGGVDRGARRWTDPGQRHPRQHDRRATQQQQQQTSDLENRG